MRHSQLTLWNKAENILLSFFLATAHISCWCLAGGGENWGPVTSSRSWSRRY